MWLTNNLRLVICGFVPGAFSVAYTLFGEMPLHYTLLVGLANACVNYWMMLDAAGGSWPLQRHYICNGAAVLGMIVAAPLMLHVAWLQPMEPPERQRARSLPVRVLQALLALHVYKNVMGGVAGVASASPPFEVLVGLVCCGVLATKHQGTLGVRVLARLTAAQAVLNDIFPEHINSALGLISPATSAGGASTCHSFDLNPRTPLRPRGGNEGRFNSFRVTRTSDGSLYRGSDSIPGTPDSDMSENIPVFPQRHEAVTILFADITGFTTLCDQEMAPEEVMGMLHTLYSTYDSETMPLKVYKVETIGDCYMAATGLKGDEQQGEHMLRFAFKMLHIASEVRQPNGQALRIRVGMHTGTVTSGLVGQIRRRFCLFGDTVNTASRMETSSEPNCIMMTDATYQLVAHMPGIQWRVQETPVKGKAPMQTHMVVGWDKAMYA